MQDHVHVCALYVPSWLAHRVSRNADDGLVRGCVLGDEEIVRLLCVVNVQQQLGSSTCGTFVHMPCASVTLSAASLQAVAEGLRSAGGMEAATRRLGTAAGWGRAAATTEALATVA